MLDSLYLQVPVLRRERAYSIILDRNLLLTRQIAMLCFGLTSYGMWKARVELKKLYDTGLVKRCKAMCSRDYAYYCGKKPENIEHTILVNWAWLKYELTENIAFWQDEPVLEGIQPDAYFICNGKPYFLEAHREVNTRFDKVSKYEQYFESGLWATPEWPGGEQFAEILVLCDTQRAQKYALGKIEKESKIGLRWNVLTLSEFLIKESRPIISENKIVTWGGL